MIGVIATRPIIVAKLTSDKTLIPARCAISQTIGTKPTIGISRQLVTTVTFVIIGLSDTSRTIAKVVDNRLILTNPTNRSIDKSPTIARTVTTVMVGTICATAILVKHRIIVTKDTRLKGERIATIARTVTTITGLRIITTHTIVSIVRISIIGSL
jgi:hypothetical protein